MFPMITTLEEVRRVRNIVEWSPYRDPKRRTAYGEHLLAAGFPE